MHRFRNRELSFGAFQSVRLVRNDWGSTAFPAALGGTPEYLIFFAVCSFLAWCIEPLGVATNAIVVMLFLRIPLVRSLGWGIIVIVAYGCILTAFGLGWFATVIHFS